MILQIVAYILFGYFCILCVTCLWLIIDFIKEDPFPIKKVNELDVDPLEALMYNIHEIDDETRNDTYYKKLWLLMKKHGVEQGLSYKQVINKLTKCCANMIIKYPQHQQRIENAIELLISDIEDALRGLPQYKKLLLESDASDPIVN